MMKVIVSEKLKGHKLDKKRMRNYWDDVFPEEYSEILIESEENEDKDDSSQKGLSKTR